MNFYSPKMIHYKHGHALPSPNAAAGKTGMQYECESWMRRIQFMEMENHYMLQRLSQLIKEYGDPAFLVSAEQFQDSCVAAGEIMKNLRKQVAELEALMMRQSYEGGKPELPAHRRLKAAVSAEERAFSRLNKLFNQYLSGLQP